MTQTIAPVLPDAKFDNDPKTPAEIVSDTRNDVANAQANPAWATQPTVQAAMNLLANDANAIEANETALVKARAAVITADNTQVLAIQGWRQHRRSAAATLSVVCAGSLGAIKAWGCVPSTRTVNPPVDDAPTDLTSKTGGAPGTVAWHCKPVANAKSYVYQWSTDPAFGAAGTSAPVVWSASTYTATGLTVGQQLYGRIAVVRPKTGQGKWSAALSVVVR